MKYKKPETRPVFLNLLRIRQPVTALVSIAHRISGILLFFSIPLLIWLLDLSLRSSAEYQYVLELLSMPLMKLILLLIAWSLAHHFFAGIRFLLLDIDIGIELETARRSALIVNILGVVGVVSAMMVIL